MGYLQSTDDKELEKIKRKKLEKKASRTQK